VRVAVGGCALPAWFDANRPNAVVRPVRRNLASRQRAFTALANPVDDVRGTASIGLLIPRMLTRAVREITSARKAVA
jgi:hypothetical protein